MFVIRAYCAPSGVCVCVSRYNTHTTASLLSIFDELCCVCMRARLYAALDKPFVLLCVGLR